MAYAELVDVSRRLSLLSTTQYELIAVDPIRAEAQAAPVPTDTEFALSTVEALAAGATVTVGTETGEVASVAGRLVTLTAALTAAPAVGVEVTWRNADRRPGSVTELDIEQYLEEADARIDGALLEGRVNPAALPLAVANMVVPSVEKRLRAVSADLAAGLVVGSLRGQRTQATAEERAEGFRLRAEKELLAFARRPDLIASASALTAPALLRVVG